MQNLKNKAKKQAKYNKKQTHETENRLVVTRGEGSWGWAKLLMGANCVMMYGN